MNSLKMLRLGRQLRVDWGIQTCRCFSVGSTSNKAYLNNVTIVGAGHMGTGIALNNGLVGNNVIIVDVNQESLDRSKTKVEEHLVKVSKRQLKNKAEEKIKAAVSTILSQFRWTTDLRAGVCKSDLVVESVTERIDVKLKLFAELDKLAPPRTLFTTNTSSLPVSEIAQTVSSERRKNFAGTHFFDRDVKLVEIAKLEETSKETYHKLVEWVQFIGKAAIGCKDTPGFIVNRLLIKYFLNAIEMIERGDADMKDIDLAMKYGAGYPYGPFELADHIGLDILHDIFQGWQGRFPPEEGIKCPEIVSRLYREGKLGRKTGEGFFKY